jgi:hypothetical protein
MQLAWHDHKAAQTGPAPKVSAAKLHVLQLEPIKARLGPRWPRLSELVHRLFEKALHRAQGPRDHFMLVGELSYIATFHGLSPEEAGLACAAVAKEVCELLFGQDLEMVSVRSLIGEVPGPIPALSETMAVRMAKTLERTGSATIVSSRRPTVDAGKQDWLRQAHDETARLHHPMGFYPVWELAGKKSQMLCLGLEPGLAYRHGPAGVQRALGRVAEVPALEIALLRAAAAYGAKMEQAGQICAIHVGVSSDTLCGLQSRIAYLEALKAVRISPASPLFLKIEQIASGMPVGRLGQLAAMLAMPGLRLLLEFEDIRAIPHLNIRLGVAGIGAVLPDCCPPEKARLLAQHLQLRAQEQKVCSFLHGLDTPEQVEAVTGPIKFGAGAGLGPAKAFSALAEAPRLPLHLA